MSSRAPGYHPPNAPPQDFQATNGYAQVQPDLPTNGTDQYNVVQPDEFNVDQHHGLYDGLDGMEDLNANITLAPLADPTQLLNDFYFDDDINPMNNEFSQADLPITRPPCNPCDISTVFNDSYGPTCFACGHPVFTRLQPPGPAAASRASQSTHMVPAGAVQQHLQADDGREWSFPAGFQDPIQDHMVQQSANNPTQDTIATAETVSFVPTPPLPQSVIDQGFTGEDFNPERQWPEARADSKKHHDYPADLQDRHIFNGNPRYIAFGNLLRLATRYSDNQIVASTNRNRPRRVFHNVETLRARLSAAVKSAAQNTGRRVDEVQQALDNQRERNGVMPKRGRPPGSERKPYDQQQAAGGVGNDEDKRAAKALKRMKVRSMLNDEMRASRRPAQRPPTPVPSPAFNMLQQQSSAADGSATTVNLFSRSTVTGRLTQRPSTPVPSSPSNMTQRPSNKMTGNATTMTLFSPSVITSNVNNVQVFIPPQPTPLASGPAASSRATPTGVGPGPAPLSFSLRADSDRLMGLTEPSYHESLQDNDTRPPVAGTNLYAREPFDPFAVGGSSLSNPISLTRDHD